jgi:hypothetical protein
MSTIMVPSLLKTAETGFGYWLYMAFDVGGHYEKTAVKRNVNATCVRNTFLNALQWRMTTPATRPARSLPT